MNYIWDTAIKAVRQGIKREDITFSFGSSYSPYMELAFDNLNTTQLTAPLRVEMNPYYRFCDIFQGFLDINFIGHEELRAVLFDLLMHHLLFLDCQQGLNKREYYGNFIRNDIENGVFGQEIKESIPAFTIDEFELIIDNIITLYSTQASIQLFKQVVCSIFTDSIIYYRSEDTPEMLIYLGTDETQISWQKISTLLALFLPLGFKYRMYWRDHFGLIGYESTMSVNHIVIY